MAFRFETQEDEGSPRLTEREGGVNMFLQVLADTRQVDDDGNLNGIEYLLLSDTRELKDLGRLECAAS